jgi:excisionase family DNA binding protein
MLSCEFLRHRRYTSYPLWCSKKGSKKEMSDLLTVSEVARILRVDDTTVRRWVKQGALEAVVLPHVNERQAYRIKRETLNRVLGSDLVETARAE